MSMTTKLVLSCVGIFLGGAVAYYQVHGSDPLGARLYIGLVMAGAGPLGAYFVGLAQKAPWDGPSAPQK